MLTTATESADAAGLKLPARESATILLALDVGLGLLRSIHPAIPVTGLIDTLRLLTPAAPVIRRVSLLTAGRPALACWVP